MSPLKWTRLAGAPTLAVQRLLPDHAVALAQIHASSFAHGWDEETIAAMVLDGMVQADGLFPAGRGDSLTAPVGFVLSRCVLDEAEILTVAVERRWRGRGASGLLLKRHLQYLAARSVRSVYLEVEQGNEPALRLYARFGFIRTGERKGYYAKADGSRATAILMSREIEPEA